MSRIIYVTGGARSGKSTYAEQLASAFGEDVVYIATAMATDDEMIKRIAKHRQQRPSEWLTIEAFLDIDQEIKKLPGNITALLLDCLTVMISNILLQDDVDWDHISMDRVQGMETNIMVQVDRLLSALEQTQLTAILVSNELGMGLVPPYRLGRIFRDIAGRINQRIAARADEAYFLVSGIPIRLK